MGDRRTRAEGPRLWTWMRANAGLVGVLSIVGIIYVYNVNPHADFHDSVSYMLMASEGFHFVTNATAHFLYVNLLHVQYLIFGGLIPQALAHNLLSVVFSLGTLVVVYFTARLMGPGTLPALASVALLAMAFTFWSESMSIEAYAMNNFLFACYVYLALRDVMRGESRRHLAVAIFLGLALLTHIQNILALPFFAYYLYTRRLTLKGLVGPLGVIAAAFAVLLVPAVLWDPAGPGVVFFDRQFQSNVLAMSPAVWLRGSALGVAYLVYNFGIFLPVVILGVVIAIRRKIIALPALAILLVPWVIFAVRYDIPDVYVYYLIPYILLAIVAAFGFEWIVAWLGERGQRRLGWMVVALIFVLQPAFYTVALSQGHRVAFFEAYDEPKAYKGGLNYYLWPGRRHAPDPLATARELYERGDADEICTAHDRWYYLEALRYLEAKGEIDEATLPSACADEP